MSLINSMLSDLETRRAGMRVTEDLVLRDLAAANGADLRPPPRRGSVGTTAGSVLLGVALTVGTLHLAGLLQPSAVLPPAGPAAQAIAPRVEAVAAASAAVGPVEALVDAAPPAALAPATVGPDAAYVLDESGLAEAEADGPAARHAGSATPTVEEGPGDAAGNQAAGPAPAGTLSIRRVTDAQVAPDLEAATRMARAGRHEQALPILQRLVDATPDVAEPRLALVATLAAAGRTDEMKIALTDAAARLPAEHRIAMPYARMLVDEGHETAALAALESALPAAGDDADYQAFAAALAQRLERHAQAVELYRAALALRAGNGVWWMGLGISLAALDDGNDARAAFRRALADPALAPNLRGFVAERLAQVPGGPG